MGVKTAMATSWGEPNNLQEAINWVDKATGASDRFHEVWEASHRHREQHHGDCTVYPSSDGPFLGAMAAVAGAKRILEVGCGLGYSALWLAHGAGRDAHVETIEGDPSHASIAEGNFAAEGLASQISILGGRAAATMAKLKGPYDLIYFDGNPDEAIEDLDQFERLIRQGGTLLSANLFLGVFAPDIPGLERTAEYRRRITNADGWITAWLHSGSKAISVRR
jgi:predicted O-methyltransferase YrrM